MAGIKPDAVVIVATVRALKYNGGVAKPDLNEENLEALEKGIPNLMKHVSNIKNVYGLPCGCDQCIPDRYQSRTGSGRRKM